MGSKKPGKSYRPLSDSEQITDPKKIIKLLERFTKHYTPLTVKIPKHKPQYTSRH